ncbi:hypothetical protein [Actinoplanes aureus]|uniref:Uncharacterized protein n=1 Tax=Actinoplanes aureus TaxID=2792083 RepID=A0A931FZ87_9ACTN|nr:hypothetical protein [Actinoplanes aureus]MBG0564495.1 hypothetical protein [Actinoplanes aureus]
MASSAQRVFVQDVLATADALTNRLAVLLARHDYVSPERLAVADGVTSLLDKARAAAKGENPPYRRLTNWWRAPLLEAAYQYLHAAQVQMIDLYDDEEVDAAIPAALARSRRELDRDDPRRLTAERLTSTPSGAARRVALRACSDAAYTASDEWHRRQRSFRNIIVLATIGITVLMACVVALVFHEPSYMPFCFANVQQAEGAPPLTGTPPAEYTPPGSSAQAVTAFRITSCPTGRPADGSVPSSFDIVIVALMGLLGGSLAAAVSIRKVQGSATPYDIPVVLATLKVPTGALTAVVGLVAIRGDFVPGLSGLDSQEQILAYALVLGYAQQLATGFLDRRAEGLARGSAADSVTRPESENCRTEPLPPRPIERLRKGLAALLQR